MKQREIETGATYEARVSGKLVEVRVLTQIARRPGIPSNGWSAKAFRTPGRRGVRQWRVKNLSTGREIVVTAARLRRLVSAVVR